MKLTRRLRIGIGAMATSLLLLGACGGDDEGTADGAASDQADDTGGGASGDPYVIGFYGPLSGPVGEFIGPAEQGMVDYFEHLNSEGGVNGRPVEFRSTDAGLEVDRAMTAFREFAADDDVLAVTGLGVSLQMNPVIPLLEENEIAGISITSSVADALPYTEWYFSWGDDLAGSGQAGLAYILERDPDARIGYMAYDTPVMHAQQDAVIAGIEESDATLVGNHLPPASATDVSTEMRDLIDAGAEYIFFGGATGGIFNSAMSTAQVAGFDGTIVVAAAGGDRVDFEVGGSDSYEYVATRYFKGPEESNDAVESMLNASGANPERFYYSGGWALAQYIEKTLEVCGDECDRVAFRDALEQAPLENFGNLAGGPVGFDEECHQGHRFLMFYKWDAASDTPVYDATRPYWTDESHPCYVPLEE